MQFKLKTSYLGILLSTIVFLFFIQGHAQEAKSVSPDSLSVSSRAITIAEIPEESERLGQRLIKLNSILAKKKEIAEIDSIIVPFGQEILVKNDTNSLDLNELTLRDLRVMKVEWNNFKSTLIGYQEITKDRTEDISKITNELFSEIGKWEKTKKEMSSRSEAAEIYDGLDQVIQTLEGTMKLAHRRLDSVFLTQKNVTELVFVVDHQIARIEDGERSKQRDYFVFDSPPIWNLNQTIFIGKDSISSQELSTHQLILAGLIKNKGQFSDFVKLNIKTVALQLAFLLLLFVFLVIVGKKWKKGLDELTNPIEIQAKVLLDHPVLVTLSTGLLISVFFYESLVPSFSEFNVLLILISTTILLPKITSEKFRPFLLILFIEYVLHTFEAFLGPKAELVRWMLIFDAFILIYALSIGRKVITSEPEKFKPLSKFFRPISVLYIVILGVSILSNSIGLVALSAFLVQAILVSTALGMVIYLSVRILTSMFILIFKIRRTSNILTIDTMVKATHQRIQPLFLWIGLIFWIVFTLRGFELYDFITNWWDEIMLINWSIGEMTISLGGILAFIGIFVFTMIISKIGAALFQDEWMVNVLPRGVAPAISLVLRIVIVTLGLYAGLTAAGVDLSKMGFILGALGVGIGFGLQNVVLNFVSGLILAFERPINLGDTIEVDMETGVVTNIGVRSSNLRTYSGAEVIIPNGDLISKKVINWTLSNRERRSKIPMKTAPDADPEKVISLFNKIALDHPATMTNPAPKTYFYGYGPDGNLNFALMYWTTFSDTLRTDSEIALKIFAALREENIQAPAPVRRIISDGS